MSHGLKGDFLLVYNKFQNPILERKEIISLDHLSAHIYFWEFIIGSEYIKLDWKKLKIGEIKIVKNYQNSPKNCQKSPKMKIAKLFFLASKVICTHKTMSNSSKVKFVRLREVPARHCVLKNCQFCAKSFELDLNRFLPQKWSRAGRIVCARMLQQENCCGKYLKMSRWMMF